MDRHLDEELEDLRQKLVRMAALTEEAIAKAIRSLVEREKKTAQEVLDRDQAIDLLQIEVDETALKILSLFNPLAKDLRFITSAMKINSDLERIGDLAVNIAHRSLALMEEPPLLSLGDMSRLAESSQKLVRESIDAFVNNDPEQALRVCSQDDEVDASCDKMIRVLLTYMMENSQNVNRALSLIFIARHLERVADHATNIGEDVVYMVQAKEIRHHVADDNGPSA